MKKIYIYIYMYIYMLQFSVRLRVCPRPLAHCRYFSALNLRCFATSLQKLQKHPQITCTKS